MNLFLLLTLLLVAATITRADAQGSREIVSFGTPDAQRIVHANNTRITPTSEHAPAGRKALRVEFLPAEWPNVLFRPETPWDWRAATGLAIDITNPGSETLQFGVRADDDSAADGNLHSRTGNGSIAPGKTVTFLLPFGKDPMAYGMRALPPVPGMTGIGWQGSGAFDLGHIVALQVFMHAPTDAKTLILANLRLIGNALSLDKIVDLYGQYAKADWPGKLHDVSEFTTRLAAEDAALKAAPTLPDRDRYGGWIATEAPKLAATGWFRTERRDGKWWLVTPEGHLFFSLGIDCVNMEGATLTAGREGMFSWLPDAGDPLVKHKGYASHIHSGPVTEGADFNFLAANLERKYGADYRHRFFDMALRRLPAWGFNTIANWSDAGLYANRAVPFTATCSVSGPHATVSSGSDYWGRMHDPFDPRFAEDVVRSVEPVVAQVKASPYCIGYFVDNELSWGGWGDDAGRYGLAYGALKEGAESPARQAFVAQLKAKYGEIGKLNEAWGTDFTNWDAIQAPGTGMNAAKKADMGTFVKAFALRYFGTIRDTLRKLDPNHLYLGCRFAWRTPEAVEAAAERCDVVSFNIYEPRVDPQKWGFTAALNKPCIIGEFHFGALDRGMFHTGLVATPDQKARAATYRAYVGSVLDNPAFVGCHWFQYVDEPLTGRDYDGENYNIGFLTVTDTPYPEMVAAAKAIHSEAYRRRTGLQ